MLCKLSKINLYQSINQSAPIGASKCFLSLFLEIMPNITTDRSTDMRGFREERPETIKPSSNKNPILPTFIPLLFGLTEQEKKPRWVYGFFIGHENINSKYMVAFYLQNKAFHTFLIHNTSVLRRAFLLCFYLVSLTYFRFLFFSSMFIVSLHYSAGTGIINLNFG